jgi:hypothetical protein
MLNEQEAWETAALLEALAGRLGDGEPLGADARRMATVMRERLEACRRAGVVPEVTYRDRATLADGRDRTADERDLAARRRDEAAGRRDESAVARNHDSRHADEEDEAADRAVHDVLWAAELRDRAAEEYEAALGDAIPVEQRERRAAERVHNRWDRDVLREAWARVRKERLARQAGVAAGRMDRLEARRDREASARDRVAGREDRRAAHADRDQDQVERAQRAAVWPEAQAPRSDIVIRAGLLAAGLRESHSRSQDVVRRCVQAGREAAAARVRATQLARRAEEILARQRRRAEQRVGSRHTG